MSGRVPRNWGARITEAVIQGMRMVLLENEVLRVGVNLDRGTKIWQFCHKPTDMDFCPIAPWGVTDRNLPLHAPDPLQAFQDSYPGGCGSLPQCRCPLQPSWCGLRPA